MGFEPNSRQPETTESPNNWLILSQSGLNIPLTGIFPVDVGSAKQTACASSQDGRFAADMLKWGFKKRTCLCGAKDQTCDHILHECNELKPPC